MKMNYKSAMVGAALSLASLTAYAGAPTPIDVGTLTGDPRYPELGDVGANVSFVVNSLTQVDVRVVPTLEFNQGGMTAFWFNLYPSHDNFAVSMVNPNWTVATDQQCNGCGSGNQTFAFELADEAMPDWVGPAGAHPNNVAEALTFRLDKTSGGNFTLDDFLLAATVQGDGQSGQMAAKFQGLTDGGSAIAMGDWTPPPGTFCVGVQCEEPPEVPLPAAAWLFGSALLGLSGVARRRVMRQA